MKRIPLVTVLGFSLFAVASAFAADGYVTGDVNLRAGPDPSYPSVAMLGAGTSVAIQGCVDGWSWCDVAAGDNRGWVAGNFLQEEYRGERVLVPDYGVQIGIPIVTFAFGTYWDDHYRNRSWYGERERWSQITPRYRPVAVNGGSHGNSHNVDSHSSYAPHNGSHDELSRTQAVARSSSQVGSSHSRPAPQHAGVTGAPAEATAKAASPPRTSVAKTAARGAQHSQAVTEHKTVTEPAHKQAPKADPKKEGDKDKDQH